MRIVICDDNPADISALLQHINSAHEVATYPCAEALLTDIEENGVDFDMYILDIHMKGMTGIDLAKKVRERNQNKLICFTSISCDFYRAAYDLYAFQYLIKPVTEQDFKKMLEKAGEKFQEQRTETVLLTYRGKMIHIPCSQILYIESQGHTLLFHLKNGQIEKQNGQLSDYETMLNSNKFLRTHQSYLVNIKNMDAVDGSHFVCGKTLIPISRKYAHAKEVYRNALFDDMG